MNKTKGRGCYASKNGHSVHHQQMSSQLTNILSIIFSSVPGSLSITFLKHLGRKKNWKKHSLLAAANSAVYDIIIRASYIFWYVSKLQTVLTNDIFCLILMFFFTAKWKFKIHGNSTKCQRVVKKLVTCVGIAEILKCYCQNSKSIFQFVNNVYSGILHLIKILHLNPFYSAYL